MSLENYLCTKCNINWSSLHSQDDGNEVYWFCPKCKSDQHLVENCKSPAYVQDAINGKIFNPVTGEQLIEFAPPVHPPVQEIDREAIRNEKERRAQQEEDRINKYIAESELIGEEKARKNYFNVHSH